MQKTRQPTIEVLLPKNINMVLCINLWRNILAHASTIFIINNCQKLILEVVLFKMKYRWKSCCPEISTWVAVSTVRKIS